MSGASPTPAQAPQHYIPNPIIRPLPTSSFGHLATGEQQFRQSLVQTTPPSPRAQHRRQRNHSPSPKSHNSPVADFILWTLGNGRTTVQTIPQSRQHSLPTRPTSPPIPQIPKNHSPVQTTPSPDNPPSPRPNHSPSPKSPKITVQTMPVQTPAPFPPQIPKITVQSRQHSLPTRPTLAPHKSQPISLNPPKSQFRQCLVQTPTSPPHPKLSHPRANHSPSPKSPKITVQTMPQNLTFLDNHLIFFGYNI